MDKETWLTIIHYLCCNSSIQKYTDNTARTKGLGGTSDKVFFFHSVIILGRPQDAGSVLRLALFQSDVRPSSCLSRREL
jgi:hypothetical protein